MLFFPTQDEDFQYFRSQGYTGSINDMHYKAMGDLGYTGSLNDRIHKYLTEKYGSFYEAMRDLRNGTSIFSLISAYAVNNFDPSLVFDFEQNYYRTGGEDTTLNPAVTHSRAGQATMTDGYGAELVTNGDFATDVSGWTNEGRGTMTWTGSGLLFDRDDTIIGAGNLGSSQTIITTAGKYYELEFTVVSGLTAMSIDGTTFVGHTAGTHTKYFFGDGNDPIKFWPQNNLTSVVLDNISVKEMPAIKWAPHNLLPYSEDFSEFTKADSRGDSSLTFTQITDSTNPIGSSLVTKFSPNFVTDPESSARLIRIYKSIGTTQGGEILSLSVFVKPITTTSTYPNDIERDLYLRLSMDNQVSIGFINLNSQVTSGSNVTYTSVGDGWYKATAQLTRNSNLDTNTNCFLSISNREPESFDPYPQADLDVRLTGFHVYRSDLGGMVNNPETGDSYVRTAGRPIGSELVTNGTFDTDSDWTKPSGWVISGGEAVATNVASLTLLQSTGGVTIPRAGSYLITADVSVSSGTGLAVSWNTSGLTPSSFEGVSYETSGVVTRNVSFSTGGTFLVGIRTNGTVTGTVDNVSVKEVLYDQPDGTLQLFNSPANVPRIEYNADGTVKGLLIEEARTNNVANSESFYLWG